MTSNRNNPTDSAVLFSKTRRLHYRMGTEDYKFIAGPIMGLQCDQHGLVNANDIGDMVHSLVRRVHWEQSQAYPTFPFIPVLFDPTRIERFCALLVFCSGFSYEDHNVFEAVDWAVDVERTSLKAAASRLTLDYKTLQRQFKDRRLRKATPEWIRITAVGPTVETSARMFR